MHSDKKKKTPAEAAFAKAVRLMGIHPNRKKAKTIIQRVLVKPHTPDPPNSGNLQSFLVTVTLVITGPPIEA